MTQRTRIVGEFIRKKREDLGMSQRALGVLFSPPVTTQFISNVERGVTPLPPTHVPTLSKSLQVTEQELMSLLEREYAIKLSGRLGKAEDGVAMAPSGSLLTIAMQDLAFMTSLYEAYQQADSGTKESFVQACRNLLPIKK